MKYLKLFKTDEERYEFEKTIDCWPIITLTTYDQEVGGSLNYYDKDDVINNNSIFPISITYNSSSNYTDIFNKLKNYIEVNASNNAAQGFYQYEMSLNTGDIVLSKNSKTYNISYIMLTAPNNQLYVQLYEINGQMPYWEISSLGTINEID